MSLRGQHSVGRTKFLAETSRFLIVTVGGTPLALHADAVHGLLTAEEAGFDRSPVVHGQSFPAVDLAARIGVPPDQDGTETRVVLLSSNNARGSLRVSQVQGLEEAERSRLLALPPQFRGEEREWYRGILLLDEGIALILNLAWLIGARGAESSRLLDTRSRFTAGMVT